MRRLLWPYLPLIFPVLLVPGVAEWFMSWKVER